MGLYLRFANSLEELFEDFVEHLPLTGDPFKRLERWSGGPSINEWLNLRLAERFGVLADFQESYLDAGLWSDLSGSMGRLTAGGKEPLKMLGPELLQWKLIEALGPEGVSFLESPRLQQLLEPNGLERPIRRVQVAKRLASLFIEYERNRPELFLRQNFEIPANMPLWESGEESWQMKLWRMAFDDGGLFPKGRDGIRWLTLPQLAILRKREAFIVGREWRPKSKEPLCIFGLPKPSHFHRSMIQLISEHREVHLWVLNPCSEFWEDVETGRRGNRLLPLLEADELRGEDLSLPEMDHPLLQAWGKVSKENVTLWCQASDYDFSFLENIEEINREKNLLGQLQISLRHRLGTLAPEERVASDNSLIFVEAPGPIREMEAMRDLIIQACLPKAEDPMGIDDFRPEEALLLLADPSAYRTALELVFKASHLRDVGALRVSLQMKSGSECPLGQAILGLIQLLKGEFTRGDIFYLLRNPMVLRAMEWSREDLSELENVMISLHIFRAWDLDHRSSMEDKHPVVQHTWKHGFKRLKAGFMAEGILVFDGEEIPAHRPPFVEPKLLASFMERVESLYELYARCSTGLTPQDWSKLITSFLKDWVSIPEDAWVDIGLKENLLNQMESLSEHGKEEFYSRDIYLESLEGWVKAELPPDRGGRAGRLVLAPLRNTEVIPSRMILVAGLNQSFPGVSRPSVIDLLAQSRRVGDADPVANGEDAFLTALHAAGERLVLSRSSRDIEGERDIAPSSTWVELMSYLKTSLLKDDEELFCWQVPLLARESFLENKNANEHDWPRPWSLRDARLAGLDSKDCVVDLEKPELNQKSSGLVVEENKNRDTAQKIDLRQCLEFIRDPLEFGLKRALNFYEGTDEELGRADHEALKLNRLEEWSLVEDMLSSYENVEEEFIDEGKVLHHHQIRSHFPEEPFADVGLEPLKTLAKSIHFKIRDLLESGYEKQKSDPEEFIKNVLQLNGSGGRWNVTHENQPVILEPISNGDPVIFLKRNASVSTAYNHHLLEVWMSSVWHRAKGEKREIRCLHLGRDAKNKGVIKMEEVRLRTDFNEEMAKNYLVDVLERLNSVQFENGNRLHMPYKFISKIILDDHKKMKTCKGEGESMIAPSPWGADILAEMMSHPEHGYQGYHKGVNLVEADVPRDVFERSKALLENFLPWPYAEESMESEG